MKTTQKTNDRPAISSPERTVLNVRLLIITAVICAITAPALYAWQGYQQQKNATAFLEQATAQEQDKHWRKAADFLANYLRLCPHDNEARIRLARAFDNYATTVRQKSSAIRLYEQAIGSNPNHADNAVLKHRLAELFLELGRFQAAEEEVDALLPENWEQNWETSIPLDSPLARSLRVKALARYGFAVGAGEKATAEAVETLKKAVSRNPSDVDLASKLAQIYRERMPNELIEERNRRADEVMNRLVAANWKKDSETASQAYRSRAIYRRLYGLPGSDKDVAEALKIAPENVEVLLTAGWLARETGQFDTSEKLYLKAKKIAPDNVRIYLGLSEVYRLSDRLDDGIRTLDDGLAAIGPEHLELNLQRISFAVERGQLEGISARLASARSLAATYVQENRFTQAERERLYARIDLIEARGFVAQRKFVAALPLLKQVVVAGQIGNEEAQRDEQRTIAYQHLADCYKAFNQYDLAATAYKQAASLQPNLAIYPAAAGATWEDAGQLENAIQDYTLSLELENVPLYVPARIAWTRFKQQLTRPEEARNWSVVEESIRRAREVYRSSLQKAKAAVGADAAGDDPKDVLLALNEAWKGTDEANWREKQKIERLVRPVRQIRSLEIDLTALQSEVKLARGDAQGALELLEQAFKANGSSETLARAVVLGNQRWGSPETADRLLKQYEEDVPDSVQPFLLRVTVGLLRGQEEEVKRLLEEKIAAASEPTKSLLKYHLAQVHLRLGAVDEARRLIAELALAAPHDIMLANDAAKLALDAGDLNDVRRWERHLQGIEGDGGTVWRFYRASRLVREATNGDDPRLAEAYRLQAQVQRARPSWPAAYLLQAEVFHRQGQIDDAIVAYQTAIDLGERRVSAFQRLIHLLYQTERFAEADHLLKRLGNIVSASPSLSSLAISRSMQRDQIEEALAIAEEGVQKRPDDAVAHVWLGQALALANRPNDAEAALQKAVEVEPGAAQAWIALLGFYVRGENTEAARTTLARLKENVELPKGQQAYILGQGHEVLGDLDEADRYYREGLKVDPNNRRLMMRCAIFFAKRDRRLAKESMQQLLKLDPNSRTLRRSISLTIASQGYEQDIQDALKLLDGDSGQELSAADKRAKALVYVRRGGIADQQEAIRLMEEVINDPRGALPEDHLILASLYENDGRSQRAREELLSLVGQNNPTPKHLGEYIRFLLKHGNTSEATAWLEQLEAIDPDSFPTVSLRAQWLAQSDRRDEIEPLVEKYLAGRRASTNDVRVEAQAMIDVAGLYAAVGEEESAEKWYAKAREIRPDDYRELAYWLLEQDRVSESIRVCLESARHDDSPQPAMVAATVLIRSGASEQDSLVAEPLISESVKRFSEEPDLLFTVATLRMIQRRNEEAIGLFRRVLHRDPEHLLAMNNLAMLLAEQPRSQNEALEIIDRAIRLAGPKVELHDTKAIVLMRLNRVNEAIELLRSITARDSADPRFHFHLALALDEAGKNGEARNALEIAKAGGLESMILTPDERRQLSQLSSITE